MNRVQFQRDLSLAKFLETYATQAQCEAALEHARWPDGFTCPRCGEREHSRFARGRQTLWQCAGCRHQASLTAGTVFAESKLPLTTWFLALYLLTQTKNNLAALELMWRLDVCYRTACRLKHTLVQAMTEREAPHLLGGLIQIDDAYHGGGTLAASPAAARRIKAFCH